MRKSEACAIVARRLNLSLSRVEALVQRASEAGLLPVARGSDRPDLGSLELCRLLLASIVDRGLGNAAASVSEFEALQTDRGLRLGDVIEGVIAGRADGGGLRSLVIRLNPAGATLVSGGHHLKFGAEQSSEAASKTTIVPGDALAAIALEFQGHSPQQADNALAIAKLSRALA